MLFCARDHFGVRPFYYSRTAHRLVFGNTLSAVRLHPSVPAELDESAIADFLLFAERRDPSSTVFAGIRRLPQAHSLVCTPGRFQVRRYWTFPQEDEIRYPRVAAYADHFRSVLERAVRDRCRASRVSVLMSGGLDSTAVAALARGFAGATAVTHVYDYLLPDPERHYAGLAAAELKIPSRLIPADAYGLYDPCEDAAHACPEPVNEPLWAIFREEFRTAAQSSRVVLTGEAGDEVLRPSSDALQQCLLEKRFPALMDYLAWHVLCLGRIPRLGFRTLLRRRPTQHRSWIPPYPRWLRPRYEIDMDLRGRWNDYWAPRPLRHSRKPEAYSYLFEQSWGAGGLDGYDAEYHRAAVEVRHPFLDTRVVRLALRLPSIPCCIAKRVLRQAMKDLLPGPILRRPKTAMVCDPIIARIARGAQLGQPWLGAARLREYADAGKVSESLRTPELGNIWYDCHPVSLGYWMAAGTK
jgi:asparagine synthase (glutamine-hydrolysing)